MNIAVQLKKSGLCAKHKFKKLSTMSLWYCFFVYTLRKNKILAVKKPQALSNFKELVELRCSA